MDNSTEVIRHQMEETRSSLQDKLEVLEEQVKNTVAEATDTVSTVKDTVEAVKETVKESVETVKESVQDTVQSVKDSLNLERQMQEHPWLIFAGATAVGFVGARLLARAASALQPPAYSARESAPYPGTPLASTAHVSLNAPSAGRGNGYGTGAAPALPESAVAAPRAARRSWWHTITDHYGQELEKLKGLAIGTLGGIVREMVTAQTPPALAERVKDVVDSMTTKLGGQPIEGPILKQDTSSTPQPGDRREERDRAEMGRPLGAAQR